MDGIGWAAAAMSAARERLETAAGNLANSATDGFRAVRLHGTLQGAGITFVRARDAAQAPLRRTGRALDLAVTGGTIALRDSRGSIVRSAGGSFLRDRTGRVTDGDGRTVCGERGALRFPMDAELRPDGRVERRGAMIDRIPLAAGAAVHSGFVPAPAVDAIGEMVDLLAAQRSFETAQRALSAIDQTRERAATQLALVR